MVIAIAHKHTFRVKEKSILTTRAVFAYYLPAKVPRFSHNYAGDKRALFGFNHMLPVSSGTGMTIVNVKSSNALKPLFGQL